MKEHASPTLEPASLSHGVDPRIETPLYLSVSRAIILRLILAGIVGGLLAAAGSAFNAGSMRRIMLAYLVALAFVLSISLGSMFFVLIQHLTRAGWAVLVRRPAEVYSLNIVTVAALALPVAWSAFRGEESIYPWAFGQPASLNPPALDSPHTLRAYSSTEALRLARLQSDSSGKDNAVHLPSESSHKHGTEFDSRGFLYAHQTFDELTASKSNWLNPLFFVLRLSVYFVVWILIAGFYFHRSRRQDEVGGDVDTRAMERWSGPAMFVFAITLTFAAFDLLMSLDPHWYSTIFGVYYFAGCAVGGLAAILLSWLLISRRGLLSLGPSDEHFRDLGRLMFAFIFFWGYIAFSQYMLLWYANVPETTRWWVVRGASLAGGYGNSWGVLLIILLLGHFIIPFFGIMSRHVKGNRRAMIFWTIWMLAMHYLDLVWLVMPETGPELAVGLPELGTLVLVASLYLIGTSYFSTLTAVFPVGDPRLQSSLELRDTY